ncbi:MAG: aminotransferase class IV [Acidimicrobiales bacterium]
MSEARGDGAATKVWLNGSLVDEADAVVSVFDHGFTVGDGVFETLKTYAGRPFAVRRHLDRLTASASGMGLTGLPDAGVLRSALDDVVAANGLGDAVLRITVTSGPGPAGSARPPGPPTVVVSSGPLSRWPPAVAVAVVPWPRNDRGALTGYKTTSYGENVVALARAAERGAGEALFANLAGDLCEGTGSNVVIAAGGRLVTPPLSSGCLAGVTRALVIEACGVVEDDIPLTALARTHEAFLTSTTREVQPIRAVDGRPLPAAPGPLTAAAAAALSALIADNPDP